MARPSTFGSKSDLSQITLRMPREKFQELSNLATEAGLAPQDYLRSLLFSHMKRERNKAINNDY